jgi:aminotransferase EvaB
MKVPFSYLDSKLSNTLDEGHPILEDLRLLMKTGDFTLGKAVQEFETKIQELLNVRHAIGVANGTDALRISLRLAGVRPGDEIITAANTFIASAGCADELFAIPRFVDMADNYTLDAKLIEKAITKKTKAIVPVHFTGEPCEMDEVMYVANKHGIPVIEDACQALMAGYRGRFCGTIGLAGAISLHPLKVLNGTGDGGLILTNDDSFAAEARLYRNHGLVGRNNIAKFGCNSRLDTIQAIFLNYLVPFVPEWTKKRQNNAAYYDEHLSQIPDVIDLPMRRFYAKSCYHLYMIQVSNSRGWWRDSTTREGLVRFLNENEIEARIHYPIPLQGALELGGYSHEDFPKAYEQSDRIVTLPVHEHLTEEQLAFVVSKIGEYFSPEYTK